MKNEYLVSWTEEASKVPAHVHGLFDHISDAEINFKPAPDKWSIGELLDHIMVSNERYFPKFDQIISGNHKNPIASRFKKIPNFLGQSILKSVDPNNRKKLKTVKAFQPVRHEFTTKKIDEFEVHQAELLEYAQKTDIVNHDEIIISSPASSLIIYSLRDTFKILLAHELRHINQASMLLTDKRAIA